MIILRHRTGPLAGQEQKIEPRSDRIMFGRDSNVCDVVFPADETLVGRRHFALVRKPSGQWTFDLFGTSFVAINGEPADVGEAVQNGAVIELGQRGGPSFEVVLEGEGLSGDLPITRPQEYVPDVHMVADAAKRAAAGAGLSAARSRQFALVGIVIALFAGGGAGALMYFAGSAAARLDRAVEELSREQARIASESISAAVRQKVLDAAYVVVKQRADGRKFATGSASPIGPETLATNAHVAEIFDELRPGERMFVHAPGQNGAAYEVIGVRKHPAYDALQKFLRADPFFVTGSGWLTGGRVGSYDVGVLRVAPGTKLGPILEIATSEDLAKLNQGFPLVRAGYPVENVMGAEVQPIGASPNLAMGIVTGTSDMFMLPADPAHRRLIHHSVPSAGGASGSPMVGPSGKLVALNSAGNYFFVHKEVVSSGRISSAVLINYAQRADWLSDLITGRADATLDQELAYWKQQTASFKRGIEVIVPDILNDLKPSKDTAPVLISQKKFSLVAADQYKAKDKKNNDVMRRQKIHVVKFEAGKPKAVIAYAENTVPLQLFFVVDGKIVGEQDRGTWFPNLRMRTTTDTDVNVYVVGPAVDVNYTLMEYGFAAPHS